MDKLMKMGKSFASKQKALTEATATGLNVTGILISSIGATLPGIGIDGDSLKERLDPLDPKGHNIILEDIREAQTEHKECKVMKKLPKRTTSFAANGEEPTTENQVTGTLIRCIGSTLPGIDIYGGAVKEGSDLNVDFVNLRKTEDALCNGHNVIHEGISKVQTEAKEVKIMKKLTIKKMESCDSKDKEKLNGVPHQHPAEPTAAGCNASGTIISSMVTTFPGMGTYGDSLQVGSGSLDQDVIAANSKRTEDAPSKGQHFILEDIREDKTEVKKVQVMNKLFKRGKSFACKGKEKLEEVQTKQWAEPAAAGLEATGTLISSLGATLPGIGILGGALKVGSAALNPNVKLTHLRRTEDALSKGQNIMLEDMRELHTEVKEVLTELKKDISKDMSVSSEDEVKQIQQSCDLSEDNPGFLMCSVMICFFSICLYKLFVCFFSK